jgi:hypothetical protein
VLKIAVNTNFGATWVWPVTAKESWMKEARAAVARAEQAERVEPVAVRHSFDGYGWMFTDNGDGSSWLENGMKMPNAELLYTTPPAAVSEPADLSEGFQEWWESICDDYEVNDFKKMRRAWNASEKVSQLAATVSEPVAEVVACSVYQSPNGKYAATVESTERLSVGAELFIHPSPPAAEVSEPLTDEQIEEIYAIHVPIVTFEGFHDYARAIEAAIRSK